MYTHLSQSSKAVLSSDFTLMLSQVLHICIVFTISEPDIFEMFTSILFKLCFGIFKWTWNIYTVLCIPCQGLLTLNFQHLLFWTYTCTVHATQSNCHSPHHIINNLLSEQQAGPNLHTPVHNVQFHHEWNSHKISKISAWSAASWMGKRQFPPCLFTVCVMAYSCSCFHII